VGAWATSQPETIYVFERYGIDYCCHGKTSLSDACRERGIDPDHVLDELQRGRSRGGPLARDWHHARLAELCDHIECTHHAYLREELPRLAEQIDKVIAAHVDRHPELQGVRRTFQELRAELEPHMMKEERVLFPAVRALERSAGLPAFPFGTLRNPIRVMEDEHDVASQALSRLRQLTNDYRPPDDACPTYRALMDRLARLEGDLHRHIHKENNILFPRAAQLEESLSGATVEV
jgi:regulator of cell morphogenesis and NO signaling